MTAPSPRQIWAELEHVHAVTYFAEESHEANRRVGLRGFWMGYFGARAAPMGPVPAGVVEATFYNFHPAMVRRAIPDAWGFASPEAVVDARAEGAAAALRRLVPGVDDLAAGPAALLHEAAAVTDGSGRPLFSANRDLPVPDDPVAALWQAVTTAREHRGDGHVAVLTAEGVAGWEAHALLAATAGVDPALLRASRGMSEEDWAGAVGRLAGRRLLGPDGTATDAGRALHDRIEARTDELAAPLFHPLGDRLPDLVAGLRAVARPVAAAGAVPYPNPIGLPPVSSATSA